MAIQDQDDELRGVLRQAVAQARASEPPAGAREQALHRVEEFLCARSIVRRMWWSRVSLAAAACLVLGLLALAIIPPLLRRPAVAPVAVQTKPAPQMRQQATTQLDFPRVGIESSSDGVTPEGSQFGAIAAGPVPASRARQAGAMASRRMSVAENATVLVSTGGDEPITLGQTVTSVAQPGGMPHKVHVWDWSVSDKSRVIDVSVSGAFAVSPDGTALVAHDGRVIDLATGAPRKMAGFEGNVRGIRFSPGGKTLLLQVQRGENAGVARVVEFPSGKQLCEIEDFWHYTFAAEFSGDGMQVLLTGADRVVRRFDVASGKELTKYEPALDNSVRTIVMSKDGKHVVAAGTRGEIYLWKVEGGPPLHKLVAHQKPDPESLRRVVEVEFSNDGRVLAGGGVQNLVLWEIETGKVTRIYPTSSGQAAHIRFSGDGRSITAVHDFYGTGNRQTGEDALVYPRVQKWDIE